MGAGLLSPAWGGRDPEAILKSLSSARSVVQVKPWPMVACGGALQLETVDFSPAHFIMEDFSRKMEELNKTSRPSFQELLAAELRLDPRQWEEAPRRSENCPDTSPQSYDAVLETNCLVSCTYCSTS